MLFEESRLPLSFSADQAVARSSSVAQEAVYISEKGYLRELPYQQTNGDLCLALFPGAWDGSVVGRSWSAR